MTDEPETRIAALENSVEALKSDVGALERHVEALVSRVESQHRDIEILKAQTFGIGHAIVQTGILDAARLESGASAFTSHSIARADGCHDPQPKFFERLLPASKPRAFCPKPAT